MANGPSVPGFPQSDPWGPFAQTQSGTDPWALNSPPPDPSGSGLQSPDSYIPSTDFMTMVQMVLLRNGVDINQIQPEQLAQLYIKAWQDPYIGTLWSQYQQVTAPSSGGGLPIDFTVTQSQFISTLSDQIFNPSASSDSSLLSMGVGFLQQQGKPLSSGAGGQQQYLASQTTNVPQPFDRRYSQAITLDYGTHWGGETEVGVDYGLPVGTQLYSPFAGTISVEDDGKSNWGKRVFVKLDNGYTFAIGHMTQFDVTNGQRVNPGDLLGLSGGAVGDPSSGNSTGPHVEVQWIAPDGSYQNPHTILDQIWTGTTFAGLGEQGALGAGVTPQTPDELAGIDPVLKAKYPGAYSLWQKYYGSVPSTQQIMGLIGEGGTALGTSYGQGGGGMSAMMAAASGGPYGVGGPSSGGQTDLASLARQAGFPESAIPTAVAIAMAESGGNPQALGDVSLGGSKGLWQIYTKAHPDLNSKYNLFDPVQNAMAAFQVWKNAGGSFSPWTTFNTGAYLKYMGKNPTVQTGAYSGGVGGTAGASGPLLDNNQIEDRIRNMPSRLAGMNMGQYFDLRSLADTTSQSLLGHGATDGIVQELWNSKDIDPQSVKDWYGYHSPNQIDKVAYNNIVIANQDWLANIYNEPGFDPRYASSQYTPPAAPSGPSTPGFPQSDPGPPPSPFKVAASGLSAADQALHKLLGK